MTSYCQQSSGDLNSFNGPNLLGNASDYKPSFTFANSAFAPAGLHSGHNTGSAHLNSGNALDMLSNKFNIKVPVKYNYTIKGLDFQAGLLTNSRQPKLGAGFSSRNGINFSAGYGVGMTSFNRLGSSPINSKSSGIQFTAGYRLFGRKR